MYSPGNTLWEIFTVANVSGIASNADSTPSGILNKNGTDDSTVNLTVTNLDLGRYLVSGTVPTTYLVGDVLNMLVGFYINGIHSRTNLSLGKLLKTIPDVNVTNWRHELVPATVVSGVPVVDTKYFVGTQTKVKPDVNVTNWVNMIVPTPLVSGVPLVDMGYINGEAVTSTTEPIDTNVTHWKGYPVPTPSYSGVPLVSPYSGSKFPATLVNTDVVGNLPVIVNAYAGAQDPATYILITPANKLLTDGAGQAVVDKTGYELSSVGVDNIVIESGLNLRQSLSIIAAATAGTSSGLHLGTPWYQAANRATINRIAATATSGNRFTVNLNIPA